jgi:excisionase family DNA binding protein
MKPTDEPGQLSIFDDVSVDTDRAEAPADGLTETPPAPPVASSRLQSQPSEVSAAAALLTTQEAAELLHVHPRTIQRLVERGELAAVHLGTAVRFDRSDLAALTGRLKSRAAGPPAPRPDVKAARNGASVSFAERLRSQRDEHRAA